MIDEEDTYIAREIHWNFPVISVDEAREFCSLLHGQHMHIAVPTLALWVLARVLERDDKQLKRRVAELEQEVERMKVRGAGVKS